MCRRCGNLTVTDDGGDMEVLRRTIDEHEVAVHFRDDARAPSAYTIGYGDVDYPETLVVGLSPAESARVIAKMILILADEAPLLMPGSRLQIHDYCVEIVKVDYPDIHLPRAWEFYGRVMAMQLVWTTDSACWPWDLEWSAKHPRQPVYGVRGDLHRR